MRKNLLVFFSLSAIKVLAFTAPALSASGAENHSLRDSIAVKEETYGAFESTASHIGSAAFEHYPGATFERVLQGQISGLLVLSNSGEPANAFSGFLMRGIGSFYAFTVPLFILDGQAISAEDFSALNVADIASVNVLKNASATSAYGWRGGNGVIEIVTKKGEMNGRGIVRVSAQMSVCQLTNNRWDMMNTKERLDYEEMIGLRTPGGYDRQLLERTDVNWRDLIYDKSALQSNVNVYAGDRVGRFSYFVSGNALDETGVLVGSKYKRIAFRANLDYHITDWLTIGTRTAMTDEEIHYATSARGELEAPVSAARFMLPYWDGYAEDGSLATVENKTWEGYGQNPLASTKENRYKRDKKKLYSNILLSANLMDGLSLQSAFHVDLSKVKQGTYSQNEYLESSMQHARQRYNNRMWATSATYSFRPEQKHQVDLTAGYEWLMNQSAPQNVYDSYDPDFYEKKSSRFFLSDVHSVFWNGRYNYDRRYEAEASLRSDKKKSWNTYWSAGLKWNVTEEAFMQDFSWVDELSVFAGAGTGGNQYFSDRNLYSDEMLWYNPFYFSRESILSENIGLGAALFKRFEVNICFYNKVTRNMLVPIFFEGGRLKDSGKMRNRGIEADLLFRVIRNKNLDWSVYGNVSRNRNKVLEINEKIKHFYSNPGFNIEVGKAFGQYELLHYAGVNPDNGDMLWYDEKGNKTEYQADVTSTGKSYIPSCFGGFGTNLTYRGLSLNAHFSWIANNWVYNEERIFFECDFYSAFNKNKKVLNRWKKPGDIAELPRWGTYMPQFSTLLLENASFLRLKYLTLSYDFTRGITNGPFRIEGLKVFFRGDNLLTFTRFTGMDPETSVSNYLYQYPQTRQFSFGLEFNF